MVGRLTEQNDAILGNKEEGTKYGYSINSVNTILKKLSDRRNEV